MIDRHRNIVGGGTILRDPLKPERRWVVQSTAPGTKSRTAVAWVLDYPIKEGQSPISFTESMIERLEVVKGGRP